MVTGLEEGNMLGGSKKTLRVGMRAVLCALLSIALLFPTVPLSQVIPAYADSHPLSVESMEEEGSAQKSAQGEDENKAPSSLPHQIVADVPLDGSAVNAQGELIEPDVAAALFGEDSEASDESLASIPRTEEEKQDILDGYLADGTLTEDDLNDEFIVNSLTGAYLEDEQNDSSADCGNCMDGYEDAMRENEERQAEAERLAEEALSQSPTRTEAEVEDALRAAQEAEEVSVIYDETLSSEDVIVSQPGEKPLMTSANGIENAAFRLMSRVREISAEGNMQLQSSSYSTDVVLKDIKSVLLYDEYGQAQTQQIFFNYLKNYPERQTAYVQMINMPSFYSPLLSVDLRDGCIYLTLQLPVGAGEEPKTFEVLYTKGADGEGWVKVISGQPVANDATMMANIASTPGYDASREQAYRNAYKLAPYASYEDIVKSGNAIPTSSGLYSKTIQELWPVHAEQGMKVSMLEGEEEDIVRNVVYFSDGTSETTDVQFLGTSSLTASYTMGEAGILYQPDFWMLGEGAQHGIDRMAAFIRSKTYNDYFAPFNSSVKMHRTVRDYFDRNIHEKAEEVAANLLTNIPTWNPMYSESALWNYYMNQAENAKPTNDWHSTAVELKMFNLLFLYNYWDRFLNFTMGGSEEVGLQNNANAFLVVAFRGGVIKPGLSLVNMTCDVRSDSMLSYSWVRLLSNTVIYNRLRSFSGIGDAPTLVKTLVMRTSDYNDVANWFADYMSTIAFYHEYKPPVIEGHPETGELYWRGWDQASRRYPDYLPIWLTMEPGAMYMGSTSMLFACGSTYIYTAPANFEFNDAFRASFKARLDNIFPHAAKYSSTVATIVGKERVNTTIVLGLDNMTSRYDNGTSQNVFYESHGLWGKHYTEDPWQKNFFDVSELYDTTGGQGAAAATINSTPTKKRILFLAYTSLSCGWSYYWSHEFAHALDNDVFLGADRRDGASNEDFTDGLLTQGHGSLSPVLNLCFDYNTSSDIMSNYTRDRIYGKDELNDFYGKVYETLDVLDYAALQAFLRLDKDEQNAVASQVWFSGQNGTSPLDSGTNTTVLCSRSMVLDGYDGTTATMPVNESVFNDGTKKFETMEEVYDNQLFLRPGIPDGSSITWRRQIYVSEDNRGTWWFPVHANTFYPDSRSFKVMMYRMMGREGYDAFATYGSAGGNDLQKLKQITGCSSYKEWQMQTWSDIEAKKDSLAYADFDDLVDKFEVALKSDASMNDRNLGSSFSLRTRMFYMMKRVTNDFRYGIYEDPKPVTHISTLADLLKVADNPQDNYVLDNDIDASSVQFEAGDALLSGVFYGKLDGQGHKISVKGTPLGGLFEGARHAYIKDLTLEGVASDAISPTIVNCELENLNYIRFERNIWSVDDFVGINDDLNLGIDKFHLMADLDFTEWSAANAAADTKKSSVITQLMSGTQVDPKVFDGHGHTITGLENASLFGRVCFAEVSNLVMTNSKNLQDAASVSFVSLIASRTYLSKFSDLFFNNVSLSGRSQIGFVSGDDGFADVAGKDTRDGGSQFSRIQVTGGVLQVGASGASNVCYGGFISGRLCMSSLEDIYVQGNLGTYGVSCGGVAGAITKSAKLNRCVSKVNVTLANSNNNGVLLGDIEPGAFDIDNTRISNCFGLGTPCNNNVARLANMAAPAETAFENCYEDISIEVGKSLFGDAVPGVKYARTDLGFLHHISKELQNVLYTFPMLRYNSELYQSLGFNDDAWEFDPTIQVGYPMLRYIGDKAAFDQYDLDIVVDYKNEKLICSGSDFDKAKYICLHNLPFRSLRDYPGSGIHKGDWQNANYASATTPFGMMSEEENSLDLSEIIEYEGFKNAETEYKGTRSVSLYFESRFSGKSYAFIKTIELPPRLENGYANNIKGIRANSKGTGAIHVLTVGPGLMPALEYRPVADASAEAANASVSAAANEADLDVTAGEGANEWIPITASSTPVPAGSYEVRLAATDSSFASYPSTVEVDAYDPNAVTFPLVLDPKGGTWAEGFDAPDTYNNEQATALPNASNITRRGYSFTGWYTNESLVGNPQTEIAAGQSESLTFYAGWSAKTYSVSLNLDGGRIPAGGNVTQYTFGVGTRLPVPVKESYEFGGWYEDPSFEGEPITAIGNDDDGDKQLYAKWYRPIFKVTLDPAPGELAEGVPSAFTYEGGAGANLPDASQVFYEGHTFAGWFEDSSFAGLPVASISPEARGDKRYFAKWDLGVYTITFSPNGGTLGFEQTGVSSYTYGTPCPLPRYDRPGYEFLGWFDNAEFAGSAITEIAAGQSGDKHYYAKWAPQTYAISYQMGADSAGATPPETIDLSAFESYQTSDRSFLLPDDTVMQWEGHTFAGWHEKADLSDAPLMELAAGSYGDKEFYAEWAGEACVLSFYIGGGTFKEQPQTIYELSEDGAHEGDAIELPRASALTRPGYEFTGWYENAGLEGEPIESISLSKGMIALFAGWSLVKYDIAYDLGGGQWKTGEMIQVAYDVESGDIALPASSLLVREGYTFKGWFDNEALEGEAVTLIPAGSTGDRHFFAAWEKVSEPTDPDDPNKPTDPDKPDKPTDPDKPDKPTDPDTPTIAIISCTLSGVEDKAILWDETGYARIVLPRDKMPKVASEFKLVVPEGVSYEVKKREAAPLQVFAHLFAAALDKQEPKEASDFWDLTLWPTEHPDDAALRKSYVLEVVPQDPGSTDPTDPNGPNDPSQPSNPSDPSHPTDPSDPSDKGTSSGGGTTPVRNDRNSSGAGTTLPKTGDEADKMIALGVTGACGAAALLGALMIYRRRTKE